MIFSLKTPLLGLVGYLLSVSPFAYAQTPEPWRLVWSDEFDGKSLDFSKWEIEVNAFGWQSLASATGMGHGKWQASSAL
ncbi:MAG: hypothetical protein ACKN82_13140 [Pirellula sp.]